MEYSREDSLDLFFLHEFKNASEFARSHNITDVEALSNLAQHNLTAIKGLQHSEHLTLKAVALMAVFLHAPAQRPVAIQKLGELAMTGDVFSAYLYVCALLCDRPNPQALFQAAEFLHGAPASELIALRHQILLTLGKTTGPSEDGGRSTSSRTTRILESVLSGNFDEAYYGISDLVMQFDISDRPPVTNSIFVLLARIAANLGRGRLGEATEDLKKAETVAGGSEGVLTAAVGIHFRTGETDKAMQTLETLAATYSTNELVLGWRNCREVCRSFVNP
jgi:hypothetical protein